MEVSGASKSRRRRRAGEGKRRSGCERTRATTWPAPVTSELGRAGRGAEDLEVRRGDSKVFWTEGGRERRLLWAAARCVTRACSCTPAGAGGSSSLARVPAAPLSLTGAAPPPSVYYTPRWSCQRDAIRGWGPDKGAARRRGGGSVRCGSATTACARRVTLPGAADALSLTACCFKAHACSTLHWQVPAHVGSQRLRQLCCGFTGTGLALGGCGLGGFAPAGRRPAPRCMQTLCTTLSQASQLGSREQGGSKPTCYTTKTATLNRTAARQVSKRPSSSCTPPPAIPPRPRAEAERTASWAAAAPQSRTTFLPVTSAGSGLGGARG